MGMKPRLDDVNKKFDIGDVVTCQNHTSGEESNANIPNTVTDHKVIGNVPVASNTVTHVKAGE